MPNNDFEAICAVKYKYGQVIDRLVREGAEAGKDDLRSVFTADASVDLTEVPGMPPMEGIEQVIAHFSGAMPQFVEWMWHAFHNPIIEIDGDKATGEWLLTAYSRGKDAPDGPPMATIGRYLEEYVKTPAGWRTSSVKFKMGSRFQTLAC